PELDERKRDPLVAFLDDAGLAENDFLRDEVMREAVSLTCHEAPPVFWFVVFGYSSDGGWFSLWIVQWWLGRRDCLLRRSDSAGRRVCRFCLRRSCRSVRPELEAISFRRLSEFASLRSSAAS